MGISGDFFFMMVASLGDPIRFFWSEFVCATTNNLKSERTAVKSIVETLARNDQQSQVTDIMDRNVECGFQWLRFCIPLANPANPKTEFSNTTRTRNLASPSDSHQYRKARFPPIRMTSGCVSEHAIQFDWVKNS